MARTVNEILVEADVAQARLSELYTVITNEVSSDSDLAGLTSVSKTAEFSLWKYIWSALAYIQESIWDERQDEIQQIVDDGIPGTDRWLQKELLKFQYGDTLSINATTKKYYYAVIDVTKQIIKRCAVVSAGGVTQIKVAKEVAGAPVALSGPELTAFVSFVRQIQWAGSNIAAPVSFNSDKLNAPMTVFYNGTVKIDDLKPLVQAAYNSYLSQLAFNGEYKISAHQDAIQAVANVNDVVIGAVQAKPDAGVYADVIRVYYPASGYIERDTTINFDVMITYVSQ